METIEIIREGISHKTIGSLVAENFNAATIFNKYHIDFCCGGGKTLEKICAEKNLNIDEVSNEIKHAFEHKGLPSAQFRNWDLDFLCDYIVRVHHQYVIETMPQIGQMLRKVVVKHGQQHPENIEIEQLFMELDNELTAHMMKEEKILFPYIRQMFLSGKSGGTLQRAGFQTVENPVRMMQHEHDVAGDLMNRIENISAHFNAPQDACNTYKVVYARLKEFSDDLHQHIHLENNILFPKAIALEKKLSANTK